MQRDTSPSHWVDQAVDCGLWTAVHTPLKWLCKVDGYWRELECADIHVPNLLWWTYLQSACHLHAPSKLVTSMELCCVTKLHLLEWPFIVPSTRCTCIMIMLFNQLLDMPHLSGGWIILVKEKCSLKCKQISAQHFSEINFLCVWINFGIFYFSSWNMGPTPYMLSLYFCLV